jgi:hypothetical protein
VCARACIPSDAALSHACDGVCCCGVFACLFVCRCARSTCTTLIGKSTRRAWRYARTHARTRARAHTRAHARKRTHTRSGAVAALLSWCGGIGQHVAEQEELANRIEEVRRLYAHTVARWVDYS